MTESDVKKGCDKTADKCCKMKTFRGELNFWRSEWCEKVDNVDENWKIESWKATFLKVSIIKLQHKYYISKAKKLLFFTFTNILLIFLFSSHKSLHRLHHFQQAARRNSNVSMWSRNYAGVHKSNMTMMSFQDKRNVDLWSACRFNVQITFKKWFSDLKFQSCLRMEW